MKITMPSSDAELRIPVELEEKRGGMECLARRAYDATCLTCFQLCPLKFKYRYVDGLELPGEPVGRLLGYLWHEALYTWYRTGDVEAAQAEFDPFPPDLVNKGRSQARAKAAMREYAKLHAMEDFNVLLLETGFKMDMPGGWLYTGRIDMIVELESNIYVLDHKTGSSMGAGSERGIRPHLQFTGYAYRCRKEFGRVSGVIVNGISTAANPRQRFSRVTTPRTGRELDAWALAVCDTAYAIDSLLRDAVESEDWPANQSQCGAYYTDCEYSRLCIYGEAALSFYKRRDEDAEVHD